ncbi:MAG: EAL domain-containing protein, partial [Actinomycetes bacterium]
MLQSEDALRMVFQPIVDLRRGVTAGYEALSRFPAQGRPDQWFAAATEHGLGPDLEGHALGMALAAKTGLPTGAFLSVNVSPRLLHTRPVRDALSRPGDLADVVVELTEHVPYGETDALLRDLDWLRSRGARIALDDTGTGYSGLRQIAELRPDVVKLDRAFVDRLDSDEVKAVFAE